MTNKATDGTAGRAGLDSRSARVAFRLERDKDGYPPADWEHLWARRVRESVFELDNTPFFARGVSLGDHVLVEQRDGMDVFVRVLRTSGHSTLRVILFRPELAEELRGQLHELGCATEKSHIPGLVAVDVPPSVELSRVTAALAAGEVAGDWEYEEASVRRS